MAIGNYRRICREQGHLVLRRAFNVRVRCKTDIRTRDGGSNDCSGSHLRTREMLGSCITDAICINVFTVIGFELL